MKKIFVLLFILLLLPSLSAISLRVEKQSTDEVLVPGLGSTFFDLKITNLGPDDYFEFYNLLGFNMYPVGTIYIPYGQSITTQLEISPIGDLPYRGPYTFDYYLQGQDGTDQKERLTFRISDLDDSFELGSGEVDPEANSMQVYIYNKVNFDFGEMNAKFSSVFFEFEENFTLGPNERKEFSVGLNSEDFSRLMAGFYTMTADITVRDQTTTQEGSINFVEKDILTSTQKEYGWVINTQLIRKTNEGNIVVPTETLVTKSIISRLFTSFSPEPDSVERDGFSVNYRWVKELSPGETVEIAVKTNWLFPLLIIIFILIIVIAAKQYTTTNVTLRKRVSFVRAKGADFGLKVSISVNARKYVEKINVIDRLPPLVKIYEKFGIEKPTRINHKNRTLEWNFEKLEAGETRILSYIIYSKVGVLGRFALPSATAIYEREGSIKESESNKAFFVAEQRRRDIQE